MGCYDEVDVRCPKCGEILNFQSKAGECCFIRYTEDNIPASIAEDLHGLGNICRCCGSELVAVAEVATTFRMKLKE